MKTCWLHRADHPRCLVFMAGWGMGPEPFFGLPSDSCDLLMVYDYRTIESSTLLNSLSDSTYSHIDLLAWSMGVFAAATLGDEITFDQATAIGGTCTPVDDTYGIPGAFFDTMIENFSEATLKQFYTSMFSNSLKAGPFLANQPIRPLAELLEELVSLRAACTSQQPPPDIFNLHIITGRDRIFPARNQLRAWGGDNSTTFPWPHFPFYDQTAWSSLLTPIAK